MKKYRSIAVLAAAAALLSGCGGAGTAEKTEQKSAAAALPVQTAEAAAPAHGRAVVVYFTYPENSSLPAGMDASASMSLTRTAGGNVGNTAVLAQMIASRTGADLFSVVTEKKYPANYNDTVAVGKEEQAAGARPALASQLEGLADYDTVFLGYPNWWGDMPMAMYTFLDACDLSGKTVLPFATSGGSGLSRTVSAIKNAEPGADVKEGLAVYQTDVLQAEPVIAGWLAKNGY